MHQLRHRDGGNLPYLIDVDAVVVVGEEDPQGTDISPRHTVMGCLELFCQCSACLPDDLEQPLGRTAMQHTLGKGLTTDCDHQRKFVGRLEDVGNALVVTPAHRGTASRRM